MQRAKMNPEVQPAFEWPELTEGSQLEAAKAHKDKALALLPTDVLPMRIDMELGYVNVSIGESSLRTVMSDFLRMPRVPANYFERLRGFLLATYFQADIVTRTTAQKVAHELDLNELRELRMLQKTSLEACSRKGLFTAAEVNELKEIARGEGNLDASRDCVRYAAFFRAHTDVLKNKTPVEPADIVRAETLGQAVVDQLALVGHVRSTTTDEVRVAADLRDRYYTLLVNTYALGESAAPFLFGKKFKDHVPSMQSRRGLAMLNRKPKAQTAPDQPANAS